MWLAHLLGSSRGEIIQHQNPIETILEDANVKIASAIGDTEFAAAQQQATRRVRQPAVPGGHLDLPEACRALVAPEARP